MKYKYEKMKHKYSTHGKSLIPDFIGRSKRHKETLFKIKETLLTTGSVQLLSHVRLFGTPRTAARQASLSITKAQSLLKLMSIDSVMPSNHLISVIPFSSAFNLSHQVLFK